MGLINREEPKIPVVKETVDISRNIQKSDEKEKKKTKTLTAKDRKNIKVEPDIFNEIKTISTMKGKKNYEIIRDAIESYKNNNLTDRERRILKNITSNQ